MGIIELG